MKLCCALLAAAVLFCCCYSSEPDPKVYFTKTIPRLRDVSKAEFERWSSAGKPFIVTDVFEKQKMPLAGYSCDAIRKEFANGKMHQEYGADAAQDMDNTRIGDASWMDAEAPTGAKDAKAPQLAPFYWGVKDGKDRKMLQKVQQLTKMPYFMDVESNKQEVMYSPEFWFSKPGAGAKAHMDAHCESTMSLQLSGSKKWRLGLPSATTRSVRNGMYGDGVVYTHKGGWVPTYELELKEGEVLFFPPSFVHETTNVGKSCAASITYQYSAPMAAAFFRSFWPRTRRIGDMNECWEKISSWAALGKPVAAKVDAEADAAVLFAEVDADGDGAVTMKEMASVTNDPQSSLNFHDTDQDGRITKEEFVTNFAMWSRVEAEVHAETGRASWHSGGNFQRNSYQDGEEEEEDEEGSEDEEDDEM